MFCPRVWLWPSKRLGGSAASRFTTNKEGVTKILAVILLAVACASAQQQLSVGEMYAADRTGHWTGLTKSCPSAQKVLFSPTGWKFGGSAATTQLKEGHPQFLIVGSDAVDYIVIKLKVNQGARMIGDCMSLSYVGYRERPKDWKPIPVRAWRPEGTPLNGNPYPESFYTKELRLEPVQDLEPGEYIILPREETTSKHWPQWRIWSFGIALNPVSSASSTQPLPAPTGEQEAFGFKDDKLGMSFDDFKAKHLNPGRWENKSTRTVGSTDIATSSPGKGWEWIADMDCKELITGVINRCQYMTTVAGIPSTHAVAVFVEQRLAVISVSYSTHSPVVQQALADKLGPPTRIAVSGHSNRDLFALRWDNGVSVVEFQEHYCGSGFIHPSQEGWSKDVAEVLRGSYCENDDAGDYASAFIWYVHKSLSSLAMTRWQEAIEEVKKKWHSEPFSLDDELGMSLDDFNAKHRNPGARCKEVAKDISECHYFATVLGISAHATAIFADHKLAAIHLQYLIEESHSAIISGVLVPVDMKQALIDKFGPPEVIRGYGDSALTGEDRRALHWDDGVSVVQYQWNNCGSGNEYERITKILQGRYCEQADLGDGTVSIWLVHKALSSVFITRRKEAEEEAKRKARSDL